jgi:hypothetical protein
MDGKIKELAKSVGAFALGFVAGKNSSKISSMFKGGFDVDGLIASYDHDLTPDEIDYIKVSFEDPDVVAAFKDLFENPDKQTVALRHKALEKIKEIEVTNPEIASELHTIHVSIVNKRRVSLFSHFVINNSKEKLIELKQEIDRQYKQEGMDEHEAYWHAVCEGFEFFYPSPAEKRAREIDNFLGRKNTDEGVTVDFLLHKVDKRNISSSFLDWLYENHEDDHQKFFQKTHKRSQANEAEVLKILSSAMSLSSHDQRLNLLKLNGLI